MQFHVTSLLYYWPAAAKSSSLTSSHHSMCFCHLCHQVQQLESCNTCCFSKPISEKNSTSFPTYLGAKLSCGPPQLWTCCRAGSKAPGEGWVVGDQECPFPSVNTTPKVKEHPLIKELFQDNNCNSWLHSPRFLASKQSWLWPGHNRWLWGHLLMEISWQ